MPIILKNVAFTYAKKTPFEVPALRDINLRIEKGEFVGIFGEKGAGKSTLIKLFNGLLLPDAGSISVDELVSSSSSKRLSKELKRTVGILFQKAADQLFCRTVYEEIAFGLENFGFSKEETKKRVFEALNVVSLSQDVLFKSPFSLSGGESQRVALASILALRPAYLVLDEPITGLDPAGKLEILLTLKQINEQGIAVVVVTHNLQGFFPFLEKIVLMQEGRILFEGTQKGYLEFGCGPLPPIASLLKELKARRLPVNPSAFTVEAALEEILKIKSGIEKKAIILKKKPLTLEKKP